MTLTEALEQLQTRHLANSTAYISPPQLIVTTILNAAISGELVNVADLSDPLVVHMNMIKGTIAKPPPSQMAHIYAGELAPATDARLAVALVVERAASVFVNPFLQMRAVYAKEIAAVTPYDPLQAFYESETIWPTIGDAKAAILALADTDALSEVQALRAEVQALRDELDITDRMLLAEAKQSLDRLARAEAADARADAAVTVKPHEIERLVFAAMVWGASQPQRKNGAAFPNYHDRGNSNAETEARAIAARIRAAIGGEA